MAYRLTPYEPVFFLIIYLSIKILGQELFQISGVYFLFWRNIVEFFHGNTQCSTTISLKNSVLAFYIGRQ
jgi:hypothetical protein